MSGCPGGPFRRRCGTLGTVVSGVLRGHAVVHGAWCWLLRRPGRGVDFRLGGLIIRYFVLHWGGARGFRLRLRLRLRHALAGVLVGLVGQGQW